MAYRITRKADADIDGICEYIAADNPEAAERMDKKFHEEIEKLEFMPGMGHRRPDVKNPVYRFWAVGNYVIAYRTEKGRVVVSRILHRARDFRKIFNAK